MLKVYLKPTAIWLAPYKRGMIPALEKTLSVFDPLVGHYKSFLYQFEKDDSMEKGFGVLKVPRGIGIEVVEEMIEQMCLEYKLIDDTNKTPYPRQTHLQMFVRPRNKIQEDGLDFLNENEQQKFVCMDVGFGKTYVATNHIVQSHKAAMVISYNLTRQWFDKISEYTNAVNGRDVVMVTSAAYLEDCVKGRSKQTAAIYLVSITTLELYAKEHGWDSLQKIVDVLGIGIKVFDEAHNRYLQFNAIDVNMQVEETIYLSATPGRSQYTENKMFSKIYSHVKTFGSFTQKLNDYYVIRFLTVDSHSMAKDRAGMKNMRGFNSQKYVDYLLQKYHNEVMEMIMEYAKPILDEGPGNKILIVIDWLKYIQSAQEYFKKYYPEYSCGAFCVIKGVNTIRTRESELNKQIILGTIGSMQNGRDISGLRAVFTLTQFSSNIVAQQLLGRLRRIKDKDVYYYDIADRSVPDTLNMRFRRRRVFDYKSKCEIFNDEIDLDTISVQEETSKFLLDKLGPTSTLLGAMPERQAVLFRKIMGMYPCMENLNQMLYE